MLPTRLTPTHADTLDYAVNLIRSKASTNMRDFSQKTALMYASEFGRTELVRALLAAGARVDMVTGSGETALSLANDKGFEEIQKLLQHAASLSTKFTDQQKLQGRKIVRWYRDLKGMTRSAADNLLFAYELGKAKGAQVAAGGGAAAAAAAAAADAILFSFNLDGAQWEKKANAKGWTINTSIIGKPVPESGLIKELTTMHSCVGNHSMSLLVFDKVEGGRAVGVSNFRLSREHSKIANYRLVGLGDRRGLEEGGSCLGGEESKAEMR